MEQKKVINIESAREEWIEFLKDNDAGSLIPDESLKESSEKEDREEYRTKNQNIERVARAISVGTVLIDGGIITQSLKYPILGKDDGEVVLASLKYDKRMTTKDRSEILRGIKTEDASQALMAQQRMLSRITGVDSILLDRMDLADTKLSDLFVSVFFL